MIADCNLLMSYCMNVYHMYYMAIKIIVIVIVIVIVKRLYCNPFPWGYPLFLLGCLLIYPKVGCHADKMT